MSITELKESYKINELVNFVCLCQTRYAQDGVVPTEEAHSPIPLCLGGTETVLLTKHDHAIHDVLQTECYRHGTFTGWYLSELKNTEWEYRAQAALKMTCSRAGAHTPMGRIARDEQIGFFDPRFDDVRRDWKVKGGKTPASDKQKQAAREKTRKRNAQVWECLETGARMNAGNLTQHQRARGINTVRRVQVNVDH